MHSPPLRILFVCIGNACRSPMAEALARHLAEEAWEVASAGTAPAGWVSPEVHRALEEIDVPSGGLRSKGLAEVSPGAFDVVVILSGHDPDAVVPGDFAGRILEWPLPDPVGAPLEDYRRVRDELHRRLLSLREALDTSGPGT